jgi:hypothetical protein
MENQTLIEQLNQPQKNNPVIILLSILLFISVAIAGFFAFQTQKLAYELKIIRITPTTIPTIMPTIEPSSEPVATTKATPDPTANWKTYKNDQYGMSFKYPSYLKLEVENIKPVNSGNYILLTFDRAVFVDSFTIKISANAPRRPTILMETEPYATKKLGSYSWYMYMLSADSGLQMDKNNILYSVVYRNREDLIFQILSTFKFTN